MSNELIVIGDVHGCAAELEDLLEKLSPSPGARILLLGDLINRGPESHHAVRIARENGLRCLIGNHEMRLLAYRKRRDPSILKSYDYETLQNLRSPDWDYLENLDSFYETDDSRFVCVHGGFLPGRPWRTQTARDVCHTKWIPPSEIPPEMRRGKNSIHWSELWEGPPTVIYGHTPDPEIRYSPHTLCIDTACVYGGYLTACRLPDMEIVQVKARRAYA